MKNSIAEIVVNQLIDGLKQGEIPWRKTWISKGQSNAITKTVYRGFNQILLSFIAGRNNYSDKWITYKEIEKLGGNVKKGEHGVRIVYHKIMEAKAVKNGKETTEKIPLLRYYNVFNLSQTENMDIDKYITKDKEIEPNYNIEEDLRSYRSQEGIGLRDGNPAYTMSDDYISMPDKNKFESSDEYYQAYFHEVVHSTGADKRLNRKLQTFDKEEYSKEELVAEIGASILCNETGLNWNKKNTQAYINGWIGLLEDKPQMMISAGNKAFNAVDFYFSKIK